MDERAAANVSPYRMTARMAENVIRALSQNTSNVIWRGHSAERSCERDISFADALDVMRTGFVTEQPRAGKHEGEWVGKITKKKRGNRDVGVVTVIRPILKQA